MKERSQKDRPDRPERSAGVIHCQNQDSVARIDWDVAQFMSHFSCAHFEVTEFFSSVQAENGQKFQIESDFSDIDVTSQFTAPLFARRSSRCRFRSVTSSRLTFIRSAESLMRSEAPPSTGTLVPSHLCFGIILAMRKSAPPTIILPNRSVLK
jgi:hypothetical protein